MLLDMRTRARRLATLSHASEQNRHRLVNLLIAVVLRLLAVVILEVRVIASLLGRDTTSGIVDKHHLK